LSPIILVPVSLLSSHFSEVGTLTLATLCFLCFCLDYLEATRLGFEKAVLGLSLDLDPQGKFVGHWRPITALTEILAVYGVGKFQHPNLAWINTMDFALEDPPPKGKFDSTGPALLVALLHLAKEDSHWVPAATLILEAKSHSLEEFSTDK